MSFGTILALLILSMGSSDGARILGLFPVPGKSHMIFFSPLLQELARRGHQVTVVGGFPLKNPIPNFTDIAIDSTLPDELLTNAFSIEKPKSILTVLPFMVDISIDICNRSLTHPEVQKLIKDEKLQFDLIMYEPFFSECFYGLIHKYKTPFIHISSNTLTLWFGDGTGNTHTPSYIPDMALGFSTRMTFIERLLNSIVNVASYVFRDYYYLPSHEKLMREHFKDPSLPSIQEMEKKVSLQLLNTHVSLTYPRPFTPNTIDVGGLHIKPGNKLPQDLQKIMDDATHGVVYFSLGSNVRTKNMPDTMRRAFLDVFAKLKQKVLWKWDADSIEGLPKNVHIGKWMPQNDILAHPNLRVFITHGGLLSTQESTYHGVPVIAVPVAGDQVVNARTVGAKGYGIMLTLDNITAESLTWALDELLNTPRYRDNARQMSALFRDQPQSPLEKAVYWTEYVLRHKGAPHLRSAALDLSWIQYLLLDVIAVLLGAVILSFVLIRILCRTLYRIVFPKKPTTSNRAKKTN